MTIRREETSSLLVKGNLEEEEPFKENESKIPDPNPEEGKKVSKNKISSGQSEFCRCIACPAALLLRQEVQFS